MARGAAAVLLGMGLVGFAPRALALPGTHPLVVSTWDARASSVTLEYRHGFMKGGGFNDVAYTADFSSTSGQLSAQFGLHYQSFGRSHADPTAHGLAGTATAVFELPITSRLDNGLPTVALALYVGAAPTALVSGSLNFITIPVVLGAGLPVTPAKAVTFTPWFELSPSVNLDTEIHPYEFGPADAAKLIDPATGKAKLTQADVQNVISKSVDLKAGVAAGFRGGLNLALHVSDYVDFAGDFAVSSAGSAFKGPTVIYVGGGFVWRWDDIVPAVLPAERRLLHESCDDIEARFRMCPNSERWKPPAASTSPSNPMNPPPAPLAPRSAPPPAPAPRAPAPPAATLPTPSPAPGPATSPPAAPQPTPVGTGTFPP
jgi:hypothetical protein